jgi:predicted TPR repeat methyltransferase
VPACDILDLGCGTGLSGKAFAPHKRSLVGIDLSPRMLGYAEATGLYDDLVAADIVPWLNATLQQFDLVLAADVLVYMGDLKPLFTAVRRVLKSGGLFAATAEQMPPTDDHDFLLQAKRRYAHGESYLLRLAEDCGFRLKALDFVTPRYEAGQPVPGVLFVVEG